MMDYLAFSARRRRQAIGGVALDTFTVGFYTIT